MKKRIVFVNLHTDWMLMRVAMVYVFKYSAAIKHGYLLKYLLEHTDEFEICNYINDRGFSLYTNGSGAIMKFMNIFSGLENRITLKKNGIDRKLIKVLRHKLLFYPLNYRGSCFQGTKLMFKFEKGK